MNVKIIAYENYITKKYDTFDSIAYQKYKNAFLASLIMEHNPRYVDVLLFDSGTKIVIPIIEQTETEDTLPPWRNGDEN